MRQIVYLAVIVAVTYGQTLTRRLKESCTNDRDCGIIFSRCNNGTCACRDGFSDENDGFCRASKLFCPAILKDGVRTESQVKVGGEPCESWLDPLNNKIRHNCSDPEHSFCFIHGQAKTVDGKDFGHCCSVPQDATLEPTCPLGGGLPSATCVESPVDSPIHEKRTCPINFYECTEVPTRKDKVCCPLACIDPRFVGIAVTGMCWERLEANAECKFTAQCPSPMKCKSDDLGKFRCL